LIRLFPAIARQVRGRNVMVALAAPPRFGYNSNARNVGANFRFSGGAHEEQ